MSNKVDDRSPVFWTTVLENELYFINNSNETLDYLRVKTVGFQTCDGDIVTILNDGYSYVYQAVKQSEAVKVDEYDVYLDSDFVLQTHIKIKSSTYGDIEFSTKTEKGWFSECVLMWRGI